jgi:hypothetical protein
MVPIWVYDPPDAKAMLTRTLPTVESNDPEITNTGWPPVKEALGSNTLGALTLDGVASWFGRVVVPGPEALTEL